MHHHTKRMSFTWTLFLIFLFTAQIQDSEAVVNLKLKKLLKRVLLLRALAPKKGVAIIPIPIPLKLVEALLKKKDPMADMMMPEMPMHMPMPMPMYMPAGDKMMGGYPMMMPKEDMPKADMMTMMMGDGKYKD